MTTTFETVTSHFRHLSNFIFAEEIVVRDLTFELSKNIASQFSENEVYFNLM